MRVHQIVEADLPKFDLSNIAQGAGPSTDIATGVKITPGGRGSFKLEYPDGRTETVRSKGVLDKRLKAEVELQKKQAAADELRNKQAKANVDSELKDLKKANRKQKIKAAGEKVKRFVGSFFKGGSAGWLGALVYQFDDGSAMQYVNHINTLLEYDCDRRHPAVRTSRKRTGMALAELLIGAGVGTVTMWVLRMGAVALAAFFTIPGFGFLSFVASGVAAYFVTDWMLNSTTGRDWLGEQLEGSLREVESAFCETAQDMIGETATYEDDIVENKIDAKAIKSDIVKVAKNLPDDMKAEIRKGLQKAKQEAS